MTTTPVAHTSRVIYLNDGEMAVLRAGPNRPQELRTSSLADDVDVPQVVTKLEHAVEAYELGTFEHYMLKEIFEQPTSIENTMRGRLIVENGDSKLGGLNITP